MQIFCLFLWPCNWCRFSNYFCDTVIDADFPIIWVSAFDADIPIIFVTVHLMQTFQSFLWQCIWRRFSNCLCDSAFDADIPNNFGTVYFYVNIPITLTQCILCGYYNYFCGRVSFCRYSNYCWDSVFLADI